MGIPIEDNRRFKRGSIPRFFASQIYHSNFPVPRQSFEGKNIIVTGANVGLGKEAAKHFARLGANRVILACRSVDKGQKAKEEVEAETDCKRGIVDVWQLDLSSYASVKSFAAKAVNELDRLDAVIENAGVATAEFKLTENDESTITTNVISTFLLAFLLLPKLKETAAKYNVRPVLNIVSSEVHHWSKFTEGKNAAEGKIFDDFSDKNKANMADRYMASKLFEVFIVREMAKLRPTHSPSLASADPKNDYPVTINMLNPGLCCTELSREMGAFSPVHLMKKTLGRTADVGSRTLVHAASAGPETHGQYLSDCDIEEPGHFVLSPEGQKLQVRIYKELCERLEKIDPGCTANL